MKSKRRSDLLKILRSGKVSNQEEIADQLKNAGHEVTQATISRDLRDLGAVKVRAGNDLIYRLADDVTPGNGAGPTEHNLRRTLAQFAVDIKIAGSMVIVSTLPGHANAVARAIDLAALEVVAGTIAGDDTIFVASASRVDAGKLAHHFEEAAMSEEAAS